MLDQLLRFSLSFLYQSIYKIFCDLEPLGDILEPAVWPFDHGNNLLDLVRAEILPMSFLEMTALWFLLQPNVSKLRLRQALSIVMALRML